MPEFMQKDVNGTTLSHALLERLESESLRATESEALLKQTRKMSLDLGGPEKSDQEKSDHKKESCPLFLKKIHDFFSLSPTPLDAEIEQYYVQELFFFLKSPRLGLLLKLFQHTNPDIIFIE